MVHAEILRKWGWVDKSGVEQSDSEHKMNILRYMGTAYYISAGEKIIDCDPKISYGVFQEGLMSFCKGNKMGFYNALGEVVV